MRQYQRPDLRGSDYIARRYEHLFVKTNDGRWKNIRELGETAIKEVEPYSTQYNDCSRGRVSS